MTCMTHQNGASDNGLDGNRMTAETYANVHLRAYLEASDEVRGVIDAMARICADKDADPDDRASALDTLTEALFPQMHNGELGVELDAVKVIPSDGTDVDAVARKKADEEATFATRLASAMEKQGISQSALAEVTGVGQSAISMMLARDCRPQRRSVEKLAKALKVAPSDLWPGF